MPPGSRSAMPMIAMGSIVALQSSVTPFGMLWWVPFGRLLGIVMGEEVGVSVLVSCKQRKFS